MKPNFNSFSELITDFSNIAGYVTIMKVIVFIYIYKYIFIYTHIYIYKQLQKINRKIQITCSIIGVFVRFFYSLTSNSWND